MISGTGLGNPDPVRLPNTGKVTKDIKTMFDEAMGLWKPLEYGMDYKIDDQRVIFGREPAYQYEDLFVIGIFEDKEFSFIETGVAWGDYGSQIVSKTRCYWEYKLKSKYTKFVDKWHEKLFGSQKKNGFKT